MPSTNSEKQTIDQGKYTYEETKQKLKDARQEVSYAQDKLKQAKSAADKADERFGAAKKKLKSVQKDRNASAQDIQAAKEELRDARKENNDAINDMYNAQTKLENKQRDQQIMETTAKRQRDSITREEMRKGKKKFNPFRLLVDAIKKAFAAIQARRSLKKMTDDEITQQVRILRAEEKMRDAKEAIEDTNTRNVKDMIYEEYLDKISPEAEQEAFEQAKEQDPDHADIMDKNRVQWGRDYREAVMMDTIKKYAELSAATHRTIHVMFENKLLEFSYQRGLYADKDGIVNINVCDVNRIMDEHGQPVLDEKGNPTFNYGPREQLAAIETHGKKLSKEDTIVAAPFKKIAAELERKSLLHQSNLEKQISRMQEDLKAMHVPENKMPMLENAAKTQNEIKQLQQERAYGPEQVSKVLQQAENLKTRQLEIKKAFVKDDWKKSFDKFYNDYHDTRQHLEEFKQKNITDKIKVIDENYHNNWRAACQNIANPDLNAKFKDLLDNYPAYLDSQKQANIAQLQQLGNASSEAQKIVNDFTHSRQFQGFLKNHPEFKDRSLNEIPVAEWRGRPDALTNAMAAQGNIAQYSKQIDQLNNENKQLDDKANAFDTLNKDQLEKDYAEVVQLSDQLDKYNEEMDQMLIAQLGPKLFNDIANRIAVQNPNDIPDRMQILNEATQLYTATYDKAAQALIDTKKELLQCATEVYGMSTDDIKKAAEAISGPVQGDLVDGISTNTAIQIIDQQIQAQQAAIDSKLQQVQQTYDAFIQSNPKFAGKDLNEELKYYDGLADRIMQCQNELNAGRENINIVFQKMDPDLEADIEKRQYNAMTKATEEYHRAAYVDNPIAEKLNEAAAKDKAEQVQAVEVNEQEPEEQVFNPEPQRQPQPMQPQPTQQEEVQQPAPQPMPADRTQPEQVTQPHSQEPQQQAQQKAAYYNIMDVTENGTLCTHKKDLSTRTGYSTQERTYSNTHRPAQSKYVLTWEPNQPVNKDNIMVSWKKDGQLVNTMSLADLTAYNVPNLYYYVEQAANYLQNNPDICSSASELALDSKTIQMLGKVPDSAVQDFYATNNIEKPSEERSQHDFDDLISTDPEQDVYNDFGCDGKLGVPTEDLEQPMPPMPPAPEYEQNFDSQEH